MGKEEAGLALAQALNCQSGRREEPDLFTTAGAEAAGTAGGPTLGGCGVCPSCSRIARYIHPDVYVRLPLPRPKGGKAEAADPTDALAFKAEHPYEDPIIEGGNLSIGIHDVKALIPQLAYAPVEAPRRVIVLREVERMTPEAQNALLKSLEEPPEHTLFILTTDHPEILLPTVRSRCQRINFGPLGQEVISAYLRQVGLAAQRDVPPAALARGSVKRAIRIAAEGVPGREQALRLLRWAAEGSRLDALSWASDYTFKSGGGAWTEARMILDELVSLARDLAALEADDSAELHNPDQRDFLRDMLGADGRGRGLESLKSAVAARGEVDSNVNLALIYSTLSEALSPLGA